MWYTAGKWKYNWLDSCIHLKILQTAYFNSPLPHLKAKSIWYLHFNAKHRKVWGWGQEGPIYLRVWTKEQREIALPLISLWASLVAQAIKNLPAMQETWVRSLGWEDRLEKGMATLSSNLAWRIPGTEEPGGLQSMGSQRVRHNWVTTQSPQYWSSNGSFMTCVFFLDTERTKSMCKVTVLVLSSGVCVWPGRHSFLACFLEEVLVPNWISMCKKEAPTPG